MFSIAHMVHCPALQCMQCRRKKCPTCNRCEAAHCTCATKQFPPANAPKSSKSRSKSRSASRSGGRSSKSPGKGRAAAKPAPLAAKAAVVEAVAEPESPASSSSAPTPSSKSASKSRSTAGTSRESDAFDLLSRCVHDDVTMQLVEVGRVFRQKLDTYVRRTAKARGATYTKDDIDGTHCPRHRPRPPARSGVSGLHGQPTPPHCHHPDQRNDAAPPLYAPPPDAIGHTLRCFEVARKTIRSGKAPRSRASTSTSSNRPLKSPAGKSSSAFTKPRSGKQRGAPPSAVDEKGRQTPSPLPPDPSPVPESPHANGLAYILEAISSPAAPPPPRRKVSTFEASAVSVLSGLASAAAAFDPVASPSGRHASNGVCKSPKPSKGPNPKHLAGNSRNLYVPMRRVCVWLASLFQCIFRDQTVVSCRVVSSLFGGA